LERHRPRRLLILNRVLRKIRVLFDAPLRLRTDLDDLEHRVTLLEAQSRNLASSPAPRSVTLDLTDDELDQRFTQFIDIAGDLTHHTSRRP